MAALIPANTEPSTPPGVPPVFRRTGAGAVAGGGRLDPRERRAVPPAGVVVRLQQERRERGDEDRLAQPLRPVLADGPRPLARPPPEPPPGERGPGPRARARG